MLTLKQIRDDRAFALERLAVKGVDAAAALDRIEQLDDSRKALQAELDANLAQQNANAKEIGQLFKAGKQAEAASIVESMQKTFDEIKANAGDGTKTVYFEVSPLQYGLWTAGSGTFMDEIANMLGLTNCFADVAGWGEISEEQVLERNPDYIVTISMYYGEGPTPEEEILSRTGWENVTAVKDGKILNLQNNELSRPGPRLADGAKAMYDFVYGE